MTFHRLTTPTYAGGLRGGDDYLNNAVAGTPAPADTVLVAGTYTGSYFFAQSAQVTGASINRGLKALGNNCDILDNSIVQMALDYTAADAAISAALTAFEAALAATATPGDSLVGAALKTDSPYSLVAGTSRSQLIALLNLLNAEVAVDRRRSIAVSKVVDDGGFRDKTIIFTAASINLTLPNPALNAGRELWLIDASGILEPTTPTTVGLVRFGAEKIEGTAATYPLTTANGRWRLWTDGTDWYLFVC